MVRKKDIQERLLSKVKPIKVTLGLINNEINVNKPKEKKMIYDTKDNKQLCGLGKEFFEKIEE